MRLADRLRRMLDAPPLEPPLAGDHRGAPEGGALEAAVLVAITERDRPGVILTVRREHLRAHAGQIAFPGGRLDPGETATQAALREASEELALDPAQAEVVGTLEPYRTATGYRVTPVVAIVPPDLALEPHDFEVADWFEAPLGHLLDPANQRLEEAVFAGAMRRYYVIEWDERRIWGATAAMLVNLSRRLQWA